MAFYIAGIGAPSEIAPAAPLPSNAHFLGRCTPEALRHHYQSSQYYFQLSYFEGFGVAMVEAMACGCVPVVSTACSLPETSRAQPEHLLQLPEPETLKRLIANLPISLTDVNSPLNVKISAFTLENYTFALRKKAIEEFIVRQQCTHPSDTSPS